MNRTLTWLTVTATCFLSFLTNKLLLADDAQPTGAWVFKELKVIRQEVSIDREAYFNNRFQLNTSGGSTHNAAGSQEYWRGYGSKDTHHGKIQNSHRWSVPPERIAGDSEVEIMLEATTDIVQTNDIDLGFGVGTVLVMGASGIPTWMLPLTH